MTLPVRFALEPGAVAVDDAASGEQLSNHHAFLKWWTFLGEAVLGERDPAELKRTVMAMPLRFRQRWEKALRYAKSRRAPNGWGGFRDVSARSDLAPLCGAADLAIASEETGVLGLNIPEQVDSDFSQELGMELCLFNAFQRSPVVEQAAVDAHAWIRRGERISDVWRNRLHRFAESCSQVTIVDRYALAQGADVHGLEWILKALDGCGRGTRVTVFAGVNDRLPRSVALESFERLKTTVNRGGVTQCTLVLVDDAQFQMVHRRYVRFDDMVCELDVGVSVFGNRNGRVYRDCTFHLQRYSADHRMRERELRQVAFPHQ
jgi:hypothetical protein